MRVSDLGPKYSIYTTGKNALPYTLQGLSLNSSVYNDFPLYNMYRHAYYELGIYQEGDKPGNFDGHPIDHYANTLVEDLFLLNRSRIEADGALVNNVAMAYWGTLYQMLVVCESDGSATAMKSLLDKAAALWIGNGQVRASNVKGYMLYNLAEIAGSYFMQDDSIGESKVNANVMSTFLVLAKEIQQGTCRTQSGYLQMRSQVMNLIKYTNIVLVQMLLHHVAVTLDSDFIELYSLAIVPQLAACDPYADDQLVALTVKQDVTSSTADKVISTLQGLYSCLQVTCSDIGAYEGYRIQQCTPPGLQPLAGYQPATNFMTKAYIDRDLHQIYEFMSLQAYSAVRDIYEYGWNTYFSLKQLATNKFSPVTASEYTDFSNYYSDPTFADTMITKVLNLESPFNTASVQDRASAILGVLEGMVMYYSVLSELESAVAACKKNDTAALSFWDGGAAFYIGSMEGAMETKEDRGQLLFGLAKSLCSYFKTCQVNDSAINQAILDYLTFGRSSLQNGQCESASTILDTDIKPYLVIPLIQANLYYTVKAAQPSPDPGSKGALAAYADSVLPTVNQISPLSAKIIASNSSFASSAKPNIGQVFSAWRLALQNMPTDCAHVGVLTLYNVTLSACPTTSAPTVKPLTKAPSPSPSEAPTIEVAKPESSNLAWGRYNFVAGEDAVNDSKFSLDVKAMRTAADAQAATQVYSQNSSNVPNGLTGMAMYSLAEMSTKALQYMQNDPLYNFYRVAFYDDNDFDVTATAQTFPFGDTVVRLALSPSKGNSQDLAADAAVSINIFVVVVHRLYEAVRQCQIQQDAAPLIDLAVGLWIGQEQTEGSYGTGWSLYALAQDTAQLFGNPEREAYANTQLMSLFNIAQNTATECKSNPAAFQKLQTEVDAIIRAFSQVLVQQMLYQISVDNRNYVELYSLAFVPQAVSCDEGCYEHLRDQLFLSFDRTAALNGGLIGRLGKVLNCLRFTCTDLGNVTSASTELKMLTDALCTEIDSLTQTKSMAGYLTSNNVYELSRIDLDILQIELFMRTRSYELAANLYQYGRNSLGESGVPISLQSLATDNRTSAGEIYQLFSSYFQSATYADNLVGAAIQPSSGTDNTFESASRLQRAETTFRTFQAMVSYMQIVAKLQSALDQCQDAQQSLLLIDQAAALFVGSIEGPSPGGDVDLGGKLLFALGKEWCSQFGECESIEDSISNQFVLTSLTDMKQSITQKNCSSASQIMSSVLPMLPIPMIQGTLSLALTNEKLPARSQDASIASAFVLAESVLPLVKAANQSAAALILNNMDFNLNQKPVIDGAAAVFNAFKGSLNQMNMSCDYVGDIQQLGLTLCADAPVAPNPNASTNLGQDLYVSTTNVQDQAAIALDVKSMEDALLVGRTALAQIVYEEGENSPIYNSAGVKVDLRSLQQFSTQAKQTMTNNPLYQIAVYALKDAAGMYLNYSAWQYADTIVQELLANATTTKSPVAAEAAIALNLWMELASQLFDTLKECRMGSIAGEDGIHSIDEAVAYWIGDGQIAGSAVRGHLLYALSEEMGDYFNVNNGTQSDVNVRILTLFNQAKLELAQPQACATDSTVVYSRLRFIINKIVSQMMIVNIQGLIHNLIVGDRTRVRVYAHAVVPLTVACSQSTFDYLSGLLLNASYNDVNVTDIIQAIQSTYPCFGIDCADVGVDKSGNVAPCVDFNPKSALAGYRPSTAVANFARIDLDILEMDILLQMGAYSPAEDLYMFGKHSVSLTQSSTAVSLQSLATMSTRSTVPQYKAFVSYFGNDGNYADTIVRYAFMSTDNLLPDEKRTVILGANQYMVLFMAALTSMQESITACKQGLDTAAQYWDQAAAWLIGSLEGQSAAGSQEGFSFWNLSKDFCNEFHTCSTHVVNSSQVNDDMVLRLYTGRGAVLAQSCSELEQTTAELTQLLYIPLIQAGLSTTVSLQQSTNMATERKSFLAHGYVYSHALLPLIQQVNTASAEEIQKSFDMNGMGIPDGVEAVVAAYRNAFGGLGVSCTDVGSSVNIDTCTGTVKTASKVGIAFGVLLSVAAVAIVVVLIVRRKLCRKAKQPDLLLPKGEFNHTNDLGRFGPEDVPVLGERLGAGSLPIVDHHPSPNSIFHDDVTSRGAATEDTAIVNNDEDYEYEDDDHGYNYNNNNNNDDDDDDAQSQQSRSGLQVV